MSGKHNKAAFQLLDSIREELGVDGINMSTMLGYSSSAYSTWRAAGEVPRPALLAAQGLLLAKRKESKAGVFVVAVDDKEKIALLDSFIRAIGIPADRVVRL